MDHGDLSPALLDLARRRVLLTVPEACEALNVGRTNLYAHLGRDLPVTKIGRATRIHIDDLLWFAAARRQALHSN